MQNRKKTGQISRKLTELAGTAFSPLDLLPHTELVEKMIELDLCGVPEGPVSLTAGLTELAEGLADIDTSGLHVVVFGGGTGLSNVVGGDSRNPAWPESPFHGLKDIFPQTRSIVCITDDGGSTGELMKDLPLIALGDLRHVMLSSVQVRILKQKYGLSGKQALRNAELLHRLFNFRFNKKPSSATRLLAGAEVDLDELPRRLSDGLGHLLEALFVDWRLKKTLDKPHCLGNLLLAAAIYSEETEGREARPAAIKAGLKKLAGLIGANPNGILPCTHTPAALKFLYSNGVMVTGEYKSGHAQRGSPVDRVFVEFAAEPEVDKDLLAAIKQADIIIFAPGSLYSSIIPILQVPGIADEVRKNKEALKILVTNLWIQRGETDLSWEDPNRRFYVSDLIAAYQRNIPGGVKGLFKQLVVLGLQDIPGSVLQRYALEEKVPIYLDRDKVRWMGYMPIECRIFSQKVLGERRVVQHDPYSLARAVKTVWAVRDKLPKLTNGKLIGSYRMADILMNPEQETPYLRRQRIKKQLARLKIDSELRPRLLEIIWGHKDIPLRHLDYIKGVRLVSANSWRRCQDWDRIYSFYDPDDRFINIRSDVYDDNGRFEVAFLIALGQSLLGNYALQKEMAPITDNGEFLGKAFQLTIKPPAERVCYLDGDDLGQYLRLSRMHPSATNPFLYTRLINGNEGFTPPGMLFGLVYAWFLDNRFAAHVEYKMQILHAEISDLIPEQIKVSSRRKELVDFFRMQIFKNTSDLFTEKPMVIAAPAAN